MADLSSWLASWAKLRGECESQSLAHPDVHLCLWRDAKYSVPQPTMRIYDMLHLSDHWFAVNIKGNPTKTKIARQFVMGIGALQSVGPWTWWLMHKRLAKAAQRSRAPGATLGEELERADRVQKTFENPAEHASDLLRGAPGGAGIRLADDAAKVSGMHLWIMVLFDIAGLPVGDLTRLQRWFPSFVPTNCLGAEALEVGSDLRVSRRNPFCESVAVIDWLTRLAKAPDDARKLPQVDLNLSQVRFAGECHNVTPDGALLIDKLVNAFPEWFPASSIFSKPSTVKDSFPAPLKALIESEKGKGYRLKLN